MTVSNGEIFISEFTGTAMLLLLGCGVVATAILKGSKGEGGGWLLINFGWGLAVFAGVFVSAKSGAHLNPAVTVGLLAAGKEEYAAATLRPKIRRLIGLFDDSPEEGEAQVPSLALSLPFEALDLTDIDAALGLLNIDRSLRPAGMRGGASEGKRLLDTFIRDKLPRYAGQANDPGEDLSSGLSP